MFNRLLIVFIVSVIIITPLTTNMQNNTQYIINEKMLSIILDGGNGASIQQVVFKPTNTSITSRLYLGKGYTIYTVYTEVIPPAIFEEEKLPKDWWPGETINKHVIFTEVNKTVYTRTISVEYPIGRHKVVLEKYIKSYYGKPYIDLIYIFKNYEEQEVELNLSQDWLRPVSFGLILDSRFGGDHDDDIQVYGLDNGEVIVYTAYSSWETPGAKPEVHPGSIKFIALFSSQDDYRSGIYALILQPLGDTIKYTYGVWFETPGIGVGPVSTMIRLEMKAFKIKPNSIRVFKFRLFIGPAVNWLLQECGLDDKFINELEKYGLVKNILIEDYSKPPYTLTLITDSESIPSISIEIYYVNDDNTTSLYKTITLTKNKELIEIEKPGIYLLKITKPRGITSDKRYEYMYSRGEYLIPIYSSVKYRLKPMLTPISWIKILILNEDNEPITSDEITLIFKGIRQLTYNVRNGSLTIYIPSGEYTMIIKPVDIINRTLSDVYINDVFQTFTKKDNSIELQVTFNQGEEYIIEVKYIPKTALINPPINTLLAVMITALAFLLMIFIVIVWRRRV